MADQKNQESSASSDMSGDFTKKPGWLTDDEGNKSVMRVLVVLAFLVAAALAATLVFGVAKCEGPVENLALYFLLAALGGKAGQKYAETKKRMG